MKTLTVILTLLASFIIIPGSNAEPNCIVNTDLFCVGPPGSGCEPACTDIIGPPGSGCDPYCILYDEKTWEAVNNTGLGIGPPGQGCEPTC